MVSLSLRNPIAWGYICTRKMGDFLTASPAQFPASPGLFMHERRGRCILRSPYPGSCIERPGQNPLRRFALVLQTESDHNILGGCIKMRWRGYVTLPNQAA
jgi:hypothetical protein